MASTWFPPYCCAPHNGARSGSAGQAQRLPLVAPRIWRDAFTRMLALSDGQLRFVGLAAVAAGLLAYALVT